jgi:DNA-directed RNA polymerase specialized sigma24 family protein
MTTPVHDGELLREYVHGCSEEAFTEFVDRHLDLVFSVAIRKLRDPDLARDVAQQVFMDVAKKARSLTGQRIMAGWLHNAAWFTAAKVLRTRLRREAHEREATAMTESPSDSSPDVRRIAPELDAAIASLNTQPGRAQSVRTYRTRRSAMAGVKGSA